MSETCVGKVGGLMEMFCESVKLQELNTLRELP